MPCYLFTYHAYRSWLPDRKQGFVLRHQGIQPTNLQLADVYRQRVIQAETEFDRQVQEILIAGALEAAAMQQYRIYGLATDAKHLHVLISWKTDRAWELSRSCLKGSVTRRLNETLGRRLWFGRSASRKRVTNRPYFDFLMKTYLPNHRGYKWNEARGIYL
jgi:REP element-mobilizing transposase RayT